MGDNNIPETNSNMSQEELERVCSILKSISKNYAPDSDEAIAIRDAAIAYTVVYQRRWLARAYWRLRFALSRDTPEMARVEAQLRRLDIEPDELIKQMEEDIAEMDAMEED